MHRGSNVMKFSANSSNQDAGALNVMSCCHVSFVLKWELVLKVQGMLTKVSIKQ